MRKRSFFHLSLVICLLVILALASGCGTSGGGDATTTTTATATTSTSTTSTTGAGGSNVVKKQAVSAGFLAKNSSAAGSLAGSLGSTAQGASIFNVNIFSTAAMPDQFWTLNMVLTTEAWLPVTFQGQTVGSVNPKMRFWTRANSLLYGNTLSRPGGNNIIKILKIGTFEACTTEVKAIMDDSAWVQPAIIAWQQKLQAYGIAHAGDLSGIFSSSECYYQEITTFGEYIGWVSAVSTLNVGQTAEAATPEVVVATHGLATIEISAVYNAPITGESNFMVLCVTNEAGGKPQAGTYSDQANLLTPVGTLDATVGMTFNSSGVFTGITLTGTTSPDGYTVFASMNSTGTSGSVIMSTEAGVTLGTGEVSATGVTWHPVGGSSEALGFSDL